MLTRKACVYTFNECKNGYFQDIILFLLRFSIQF